MCNVGFELYQSLCNVQCEVQYETQCELQCEFPCETRQREVRCEAQCEVQGEVCLCVSPYEGTGLFLSIRETREGRLNRPPEEPSKRISREESPTQAHYEKAKQ